MMMSAESSSAPAVAAAVIVRGQSPGVVWSSVFRHACVLSVADEDDGCAAEDDEYADAGVEGLVGHAGVAGIDDQCDLRDDEAQVGENRGISSSSAASTKGEMTSRGAAPVNARAMVPISRSESR
jgi:hypothetical protein